MKIYIIIPVFNESLTISDLLKEIKKLNYKVIVVDDGSWDSTADIAKEEGALVISNSKRQGKGSAIRKGFEYVLKQNFDAIILMDGDMQHLPGEIPQFIEKASLTNADIVVGNRLVNRSDMTLIRYITNTVMSFIVSLYCKQKIKDTQCGFKLIKKRVVENIKINTSNYEFDSELLIKAARSGYKIESILIKSIYNNEASKINPVLDTMRFIRFLFSITLEGLPRADTLTGIFDKSSCYKFDESSNYANRSLN